MLTEDSFIASLHKRATRAEARSASLSDALAESLAYISECNHRGVIPNVGPAYEEALKVLEGRDE